MSDRSKQLAQEFRARQESEAQARKEKAEAELIASAKVVLDRRMLAQEASEIWERLRETFIAQCNELNAEPNMANTLSVSHPNESQIIIARAGDRQPSLRVSFGQNDYRIRLGGLPTEIGPFRVKVFTGESEPSIVGEDGRAVDLDVLVDACISRLLGLL